MVSFWADGFWADGFWEDGLWGVIPVYVTPKSIDLRGIVNGITSTINPNKTVTVLRSTGFTVGAGMRQVPAYAASVTGPAQIQAASSNDLKQLDGLNIQGTVKTIFLRGVLAGVIRPNATGGDIVQIDGQNWLVVKVLEGWPTWTKALICLQGAST